MKIISNGVEVEIPSGSGTSEEIYSTEETVIGSWIDGRPLYQKTVQFTSPNNTGGTNVVYTDDNANKPIDIEGFLISSSNDYIPLNMPTVGSGGNGIYCGYYNESKYVMAVGVATFTNRPVYMTIKYIKTTD